MRNIKTHYCPTLHPPDAHVRGALADACLTVVAPRYLHIEYGVLGVWTVISAMQDPLTKLRVDAMINAAGAEGAGASGLIFLDLARLAATLEALGAR